MKTKEELKTLKEEVESVDEKLRELTSEDPFLGYRRNQI